ncbi:uncharacterized protein DSM5745_09652 [Aspergillus mulundensis]|uniref:Cytochrome P450 n=1 Tax=Aspergillus mulundensis TaxID=1810919 RepID=A0A3D8QVN4_9EURO|nr:hypothetical protein DSM5745_09652 [Aspergillus mulundensis]RDW65913.1 hypothetical protein DSM5745_09652 [Aspergillus mulundensis]
MDLLVSPPKASALIPVLLGFAIALFIIKQRKPALRLPPGPPATPVLGHLHTIPHSHPEHAFIQWGKEFNSDILSLHVLGRPIIVLNSIEAARELLEKRGANYADRPRFVLFEVMGWGVTLTFLRWSPRFKLHRKLLQSSFTHSACKPYRAIQEEEARRAIKAITERPEEWEMLLRQFSTAVVLRIGFGIDVQEKDDPYVKMAIDVEEATGEGGVPAASIVDFFPVLRHLPSWAARVWSALRPLAHARATKPSIQALHDSPWDATEPFIRSGTATQPSFMRTHLEQYIANKKAGKSNEGVTIANLKGAV